MNDSPQASRVALIDALEVFHDLVAAEPLQPRQQIAESVVMHWTRVAEGKETVQPRLTPGGAVPLAFHDRIEIAATDAIDACLTEPRADAFAQALAARLDPLGEALAAYEARDGYRSSAEQCDRMMLALAGLSRFLGVWLHAAEAGWPSAGNADGAPAPEAALLPAVRQALYLWELPINEALVGWEENSLGTFNSAVQEIGRLLALDPAERAAITREPGLPFRRRGRRRQKVTVFSPEQRLSRGKSMFSLRFNQLLERVERLDESEGRIIEALITEATHLAHMVRENRFQLAAPPGFLQVGRPGSAVIRAKPSTHPFLLDPMGFFKKTVLFHNATYTREGGGLELMYLQLMQFWRYLRYHPRMAARGLLRLVEACEFAWEENRWSAFRESLLQLGMTVRDQAAAQPERN